MRGPPALLALALVVAGCVGDAPEEDAVAARDAGPGAVGAAAATSTARHALEAPVDVTSWFNGTFTLQQHGRLVSQLPRLPVGEPTNQVRFDVSELIPRNVPLRLIGEVNADVGRGDVDLWPVAPPGEFRTGNWDAPYGGYTRFEVGLVHESADPIEIVLQYDEIDENPEFPYVLSVRVIADPELLLNGIPAGIELPADARFSVELEGEPREGEDGAPHLMVFSPTDDLVGSFPLRAGATEIEIPDGSPAGEYALLLSQGGRNARVVAPVPNATLRALREEFVISEPRPGDAPGHAAWSVTYERVPILVGVAFTAPNVAMNVGVTLTGPDGVVIDGRVEGGPWASWRLPDGTGSGPGFWWDTGYGTPGLAKGTYEGVVRFDQGAGHEPVTIQDVAAFLIR